MQGKEDFDLNQLENQLKDVLERHLSRSEGQAPPNLAESIRYSLLSPGKRIRPRLVFACAEMLGLPFSQVLPAAIALEMTHCFTLIHDDLPCMDNDDFRRGLPTNHKKFGESLALLAGDALMALAVEVFLDSPLAPHPLLSGLKVLTWAMGPRGVIGGQAAEALLNSKSTFSDLRQMHAQKTGALFSAALLIPKEFAEISDDTFQGQLIRDFADKLGLAFQIADDLEDAAEKNQGKMPTSILSYVSAEEAWKFTKSDLTAATEKLIQNWGRSAQRLKIISDEVLLKTEKAYLAGMR